MYPKRVSRMLLTALSLSLCLTPMAAQARDRGDSREMMRSVSSSVQVREGIFTSLWRGLINLFEKEGASIDPSGKPGTGTGTGGSGTNGGSVSIDPSGVPTPGNG